MGLSWDALETLPGLLAGLPAVRLPDMVTDLLPSLSWPPVGSPGRGPLLAGLLASSLLVFGYFQSLLTIRRSRWHLLLPILLFTLIPPAWPDLLWRLPLAICATLLFARSLSVASPFFLLGGFYLASELPRVLERGSLTAAALARVRLPALPFEPAAAAAALLLLLSVGAALIWGRKKEAYSPETLYFHHTLNKPHKTLQWRVAPGMVIIIFSLLAAVILVFGFLQT